MLVLCLTMWNFHIIVYGYSESCINWFLFDIVSFYFAYLYLFGLKKGLEILFGQFWSPKSPFLPSSDYNIYLHKEMHIQVNFVYKIDLLYSEARIWMWIWDIMVLLTSAPWNLCTLGLLDLFSPPTSPHNFPIHPLVSPCLFLLLSSFGMVWL